MYDNHECKNSANLIKNLEKTKMQKKKLKNYNEKNKNINTKNYVKKNRLRFARAAKTSIINALLCWRPTIAAFTLHVASAFRRLQPPKVTLCCICKLLHFALFAFTTSYLVLFVILLLLLFFSLRMFASAFSVVRGLSPVFVVAPICSAVAILLLRLDKLLLLPPNCALLQRIVHCRHYCLPLPLCGSPFRASRCLRLSLCNCMCVCVCIFMHVQLTLQRGLLLFCILF